MAKNSNNFDSFDYNSILSTLTLLSIDKSEGLTLLCTVAPRPVDAAGLGFAANGASTAVRLALAFLINPSHEALRKGELLHALSETVNGHLLISMTSEVPAIKGRSLGNFPSWKLAVDLGTKEFPVAAMIVAGLWLLYSAITHKAVPRAVARNILKFGPSCALAAEELRGLLDHNIDALDTNWPWLASLKKKWPRMRNLLLADPGLMPPPPSFNMRARGQLSGKAIFASPNHQAGTANHRTLSSGQFKKACDQVAIWAAADDWRGAFAICAALTSLSIDLVPEIPLNAQIDGECVTCINTDTGTVFSDLSFLAEDAADAPTNGNALPASLVIQRPFPAPLADRLRRRRALHPEAKTLKGLYPESTALSGEQAMIDEGGEIVPSWARWGNSVGIHARHIGIDNLLVSIITSDFGHIPRSKIHYAVISPLEVWQASSRCFKQFGWGDVEPQAGNFLSFGSRAVPTDRALSQASAWHIQELERMRPARAERNLGKLLAFHHCYTRYIAFELALLLGLRQCRSYQLYADINEDFDTWVEILDKQVPGPAGALPVVLCDRAKKLINLYRTHCTAMSGRLERLGKKGTALFEWLLAVTRRERVALLCTASALNMVDEVGSHLVFSQIEPTLTLAPDAGRKWIENLLRKEGLKSGDIDAAMRHEVLGQARSSSTADFTLLEWVQRVAPAIDRAADAVLPPARHGLSRR